VAVHLSSKLYQKQDDHILYSTRLARQIGEAEQSLGHSRTLIIGDLNMNPFESGVVGAEALHGVADRRIAKKKFRSVQGEKRQFFYNPMWSYFGEAVLVSRAISLEEIARESRFILASHFYQKGYLSSGAAAPLRGLTGLGACRCYKHAAPTGLVTGLGACRCYKYAAPTRLDGASCLPVLLTG